MVNLTYLTGGHILNLLEACEILEDLKINASFSSLELGPAAVSRTVLPKLRTLAFRDMTNLDYLEYLIAPSLESLDIGFERFSTAEDTATWDFHNPLKSFVARSKCKETLKSLRIHDTPFSPGELTAIVMDLPRLNRLTLDKTPVRWEHFFDNLEENVKAFQVSGTKFPPLRVLELLQVSRQSGVIGAALHFLYGRGHGSCQLVVSYESLPEIPDHACIAQDWEWVTKWDCTPSPNSATLQQFGINVSIIPPSAVYV